jgi:hypothetical protein
VIPRACSFSSAVMALFLGEVILLSAYISVASLRISFFSPPILLSSISRYTAAEIGKLYVCDFSFTARLNGSEFWREENLRMSELTYVMTKMKALFSNK